VYFSPMGWNEMEAQASKMTHERNAKRLKIATKLDKIKEFNNEHPIIVTPTETVVVYQSEPDPDEIAKESARWIGGYHARLLKGFCFVQKKK